MKYFITGEILLRHPDLGSKIGTYNISDTVEINDLVNIKHELTEWILKTIPHSFEIVNVIIRSVIEIA